jgi:nucleoside-diphosphate-sugar epimerase
VGRVINPPVRILVTGGAGFVGAHLVRAAADRGAQVTATDLTGPPGPARALWAGRQVRYGRLDVREAGAVRALVADVRPSVVIHAAAITDPTDERTLTAVNVGGTAAVLESAAQVGARTVLVSSASVYQPVADQDDPVLDETSPVRADPTGYPASKLAAEALTDAARATGQDVVIARVAACFGPLERSTGARRTMSIPHAAISAALTGRAVRADPRQEHTALDPTWVGDIADAVAVIALTRHLPYRLFNVGAGQAVTLGELAAAVTAAAGTTADADALVLRLPARQRTGHLAVERLHALPVPDPTPLPQALSTYLDWLREHPY